MTINPRPLVERIVAVILDDLNGRKGFDFDDLDEDTMREIRGSLYELVQNEIDKEWK